jgi:nicotinate-nucleotide adenylyltransferase
MKIGLFFGSFNPVHVGHLIIAETLLNESDLDKIWFVISPQNPFKQKSSLLNEYDRLHLVSLATRHHDKIQPSDIEFSLPQPSYTIDTLTHAAAKFPNDSFSLIMGADNLESLPKWKNYQVILEHYAIYVYPRPGYEKQINHPNVKFVQAPLMELSATKIRELRKMNKSIRYMVTESVENYIIENNLYAN